MKQIILLLTLMFISVIAFCQTETFNENQSASYVCSSPIKLEATNTSASSQKVFFLFDTERSSSDLRSMGIRLLSYPTTSIMGFLVNTTDSTFQAERDGRSLIMIQEALDEKGNWEPIEYWASGFCGNSYDRPLILEAGKYVMVPIKKYSGNFKTRIRLKFFYGPALLYSDSFEGSIDKAQFKKLRNEDNRPVSYLDIE